MAFCLEFEEAEEEDEDAVDRRPLRRLLVRERFRDFFALSFSIYPPRYMVFLPRRRFVFPAFWSLGGIITGLLCPRAVLGALPILSGRPDPAAFP